ncbi:hypothetical protein LSAT2_022504 [Lamellibrachia satsuma]|nr:hypothetical protein LSAT2_022504 [Lamellibrachia satsuma]
MAPSTLCSSEAPGCLSCYTNPKCQRWKFVTIQTIFKESAHAAVLCVTPDCHQHSPRHHTILSPSQS